MSEPRVPDDLAESWQIIHGYSISIRPLRRSDLEIESAFVEGLSSETRYNRLLGGAIKVSREYIEQLTSIDYDRAMALAAVVMGSDAEVLIGVARYVIEDTPAGEPSTCEFAIVIADAWQGRGIGWRMMGKLIEVARSRGLARMVGEILSGNHTMLQMVRRLGFHTSRHPQDATITRAVLDLAATN